MICGVYRLCSSGDEGAVKERLSRLPKSSIQQCTKAPSDDEDVDVSKYCNVLPLFFPRYTGVKKTQHYKLFISNPIVLF